MPKVLDAITPLDPHDEYSIYDTKYGNTPQVVRSEQERLAISKERTDGKIVYQIDSRPYKIYLGSVVGGKATWDFIGYIEDSGAANPIKLDLEGGAASAKYTLEQNLEGGIANSEHPFNMISGGGASGN